MPSTPSSGTEETFSHSDVVFGLLGVLVIVVLLCGLVCVYCRCAYNLLRCDARRCSNMQTR